MKLQNEEEIEKEISRSKKSLKSAKRLFEEGLLEDAISRSMKLLFLLSKNG